jgi:hypothetical protein
MLATRPITTSLPRRLGRGFFFTAWLAALPALASASESYLDNGRLRIGVRTDSGACIGWVSSSVTGQNVINTFDFGRFIQQSYYGDHDGVTWAGKEWSWNPVQGGSFNGLPSTLLAFTNTGALIYAKTMPKRWDTGADAPAVAMEEWITLNNACGHIHFRMTYQGTMDQPLRDQEMPAVFVDANLNTLVTYNGTAPWTNGKLSRMVPPATSTRGPITENWAAYVGPSNWGFGVYVPGVDRITCYRYAGVQAGPPGDACSYFAPLKQIAITRGLVVNYDVYLTLGSVDQIRSTFAAIHGAASHFGAGVAVNPKESEEFETY